MTPLERDHERGLNGALAAEVRAELAVQNRKQTWLAAKADMDRVTMRRYVMAERAMNTAIVEVIATALGVDAGELMARAVQRRNRYPDLYGPIGGCSTDVDPDEQASLDATDAHLDRLRQPTPRAPRDRKTGA